MPPFLLPERSARLYHRTRPPGRDPGHRSDPGDGATLKRLGVESAEDLAYRIMRRGSTEEGTKPAQKRSSFLSKRAISVDASDPASTASSAKSSTSSSG